MPRSTLAAGTLTLEDTQRDARARKLAVVAMPAVVAGMR
jgi:hypothetical protein